MPKEVKQKSGIAIGLNKGHLCEIQKVTPRQPKPKISNRHGYATKRTTFVREIVKEVSGLAPYERRVIELLRNSKDKRARKLAKKRLGTFGRAKAKVDEMTKVIAEARRAGQH
ncbi:MAG: 60S ribosomal protein L36 [Bogoriella megaspora]|nr:MAG: 60S ribosomal protein L36 [Bogoriella megaspora]